MTSFTQGLVPNTTESIICFCIPDLVPDTTENIIYLCDNNTLVRLSGVNKEAYQFLSNDGFFKKHYFDQHPYLKPYNKLFPFLRSHHPSNCWKVMCQLMDPQENRMVINGMNFPFVSRVSLSFINGAMPSILAELKSQRQLHEARLKDTCGSYYADPDSPIDQAWKKFAKCDQELTKLHQELEHFGKSLYRPLLEIKAIHPEAQVHEILEETSKNTEYFLGISEEEFRSMSDEERKGMHSDHFSLYRSLAESLSRLTEKGRKIENKASESNELYQVYRNLENARKDIESSIQFFNRRIDSITSNPTDEQLKSLNAECRDAYELEQTIENQHQLNQCHAELAKLNRDPKEKTPEALEGIRRLINASTDPKSIWLMLYNMCANRVIEDSWAEKHFQDFLSELSIIIKYKFIGLSKIIEFAQKNKS